MLALTYVHASAFPADVLADGRILFESGFPLGLGSTPELYAMYADGSGVEAYRCDHGRARWGGAQLASGDVVFTHGASLARFTSALAHEEAVAAPRAEYAGGIAETASGAWLVSARVGGEAHYAIGLWNPHAPAGSGPARLENVLTVKGANLVEPVLVAPRARPRRFPSGLHPWNYANLLALDARVSLDGDVKETPASVRLESLDAQGHVIAHGAAPVEARRLILCKDSRRSAHSLSTAGSTRARCCAGSGAGSGFAMANSASAWAAMRDRSARRRIACRKYCCASTTPVDLTGANGAMHAAMRNGLPGGSAE